MSMPYNYKGSELYQKFVELGTQYGLINVILPFILIFSVIYALLESSELFKTSDDDVIYKKLNIGFAFGFALMAVSNKYISSWFTIYIPNVTFLMILFLTFMVALALLASGERNIFKEHKLIGGTIILLIAIFILYLAILPFNIQNVASSDMSNFIDIIRNVITPDIITYIALLGIFIVFVKWFTSEK